MEQLEQVGNFETKKVEAIPPCVVQCGFNGFVCIDVRTQGHDIIRNRDHALEVVHVGIIEPSKKVSSAANVRRDLCQKGIQDMLE